MSRRDLFDEQADLNRASNWTVVLVIVTVLLAYWGCLG